MSIEQQIAERLPTGWRMTLLYRQREGAGWVVGCETPDGYETGQGATIADALADVVAVDLPMPETRRTKPTTWPLAGDAISGDKPLDMSRAYIQKADDECWGAGTPHVYGDKS